MARKSKEPTPPVIPAAADMEMQWVVRLMAAVEAHPDIMAFTRDWPEPWKRSLCRVVRELWHVDGEDPVKSLPGVVYAITITRTPPAAN